MGSVQLRGVEKSYGDTKVIHGVNLEVQDGEFCVFVGPSGCGKSTLLRMVAGLEEITGGEIYIGGKLANNLPPSQRGAAMVFQTYALYPHMTVAENMGFALRLAGASKQEINNAVGRAADILRISHLLNRKPKALSGGERQRVAIGRAIVRKPKVFLFDEPLSNLDAALRVQMRIELSKLHKELKTTMIYVTHDQVEAMTMGDRIVVINKGVVEQVGKPLELYNNPANQFVAGFLGSPKMNLIPCKMQSLTDKQITVEFANGTTLGVPAKGDSIAARGTLTLGIRPEHISLVSPSEGLRATVDLVEHLGDTEIVYVELPKLEQPIAVKLHGERESLKPGDVVGLKPNLKHCVLFNTAGKSIQLQ